jgi:hypothetical protein
MIALIEGRNCISSQWGSVLDDISADTDVRKKERERKRARRSSTYRWIERERERKAERYRIKRQGERDRMKRQGKAEKRIGGRETEARRDVIERLGETGSRQKIEYFELADEDSIGIVSKEYLIKKSFPMPSI